MTPHEPRPRADAVTVPPRSSSCVYALPLIALACSFAACGRIPGQFEIVQNQAPHPGCVIDTSPTVYRGDGSTRHEQLARDPSMSFYSDELRSPVQVGDLAAAILELASLDVSGPLHVAGADGLSRLEFARLIGGPSVRGGPRPPGRPGDCRLDSSKARSLLATQLRGVREVVEDLNH